MSATPRVRPDWVAVGVPRPVEEENALQAMAKTRASSLTVVDMRVGMYILSPYDVTHGREQACPAR